MRIPNRNTTPGNVTLRLRAWCVGDCTCSWHGQCVQEQERPRQCLPTIYYEHLDDVLYGPQAGVPLLLQVPLVASCMQPTSAQRLTNHPAKLQPLPPLLLLSSQVKVLVEVGAADPCLPDRWQQTALDEARSAGAAPVVTYLSSRVPGAFSLPQILLSKRP